MNGLTEIHRRPVMRRGRYHEDPDEEPHGQAGTPAEGMVTREDFSIEDGPLPEPGPGELYTGGNHGKLVLKV
jgi:hypothetical protein